MLNLINSAALQRKSFVSLKQSQEKPKSPVVLTIELLHKTNRKNLKIYLAMSKAYATATCGSSLPFFLKISYKLP